MKKIIVGATGALILLWATLFLVYLPSQLMQAAGEPFTAAPDSVGLEFDDLSIPVTDEDLSLSAWWIPAENAKATILFVHGANANKEDFYFGALDFYKEMVARHYNVMAIDLRNHGGSDKTASGNLAYGAEEYRDVSAALTMIETLAPGLPTIGTGVSMGGATLVHAATHDQRMKALILVDPLLEPESATLAGMQAITGLPAFLLRPTLWSSTTLFGLGGEGPSLLDLGKTLTLPILLIQDPEDPVTQAPFAQALADGNQAVAYHLVPAAPATHPVIMESEGWGAHAVAYRVFKEEVLAEIDRFLAAI